MIVDIIAVALVALCVVGGIKKGFVKAFFGTLSFILAFILTFTFSDSAFRYVSESKIGEMIYEKTAVNIVQMPEDAENKGFFDELIDKKGIMEKAAAAQKSVSDEIGDTVIKLLTNVALFAAITLALKILASILNFVAKLPVLKSFNRVGGLLAGVMNAYIVLTAFSCLMTFIGAASVSAAITEQMNTSKVVSWFYLNNPLI